MKSTKTMPRLNPTLWRTCKMLAGHKRIQLLRQLFEQPGRSVTTLGRSVGIKRAYASQELRRIQSRGLLQAERHGLPLVYRLDPDPQVSSAAPLLQAIQSAFAAYPPVRDLDMCVIANGLAHGRRIAIVRLLQEGPCTTTQLQLQMHLSSSTSKQHLRPLLQAGFIRCNIDTVSFKVPAHPLARALVNLLNQAR